MDMVEMPASFREQNLVASGNTSVSRVLEEMQEGRNLVECETERHCRQRRQKSRSRVTGRDYEYCLHECSSSRCQLKTPFKSKGTE